MIYCERYPVHELVSSTYAWAVNPVELRNGGHCQPLAQFGAGWTRYCAQVYISLRKSRWREAAPTPFTSSPLLCQANAGWRVLVRSLCHWLMIWCTATQDWLVHA